MPSFNLTAKFAPFPYPRVDRASGTLLWRSNTKSYLVTPDWSGQTPFAPTDPPVFETGVLDSEPDAPQGLGLLSTTFTPSKISPMLATIGTVSGSRKNNQASAATKIGTRL